MFEATMEVAPAKPNNPSTDGAAIGCRNTRVSKPFRATSRAVCRRLASIVLDVSTSFSIVLRFFLIGLRSV
jgi:hypothetical protein